MGFMGRVLALAGLVAGMPIGSAEALTVDNKTQMTMKIFLYDHNDVSKTVTCWDFVIGPNSSRTVSTGEMRFDAVRDCNRFDRLYLKAESTTATFPNVPPNCFAPYLAKDQTVEIFVQDGGVTLDPTALDARIRSLVQRLAASGVQAGDAVLFVGDQGVGAFVAFWAAVLQGAVFAPLDPSRPVPYLQAVARRIEPRVAIIVGESLHRSGRRT